jgi:hypothetical protein
VRRLAEIRRPREVDVGNECLRIAVHERKPGALDFSLTAD